MRNLKAYILSFILIGVGSFTTSCSDDGYSLGDMWGGIATVDNIDDSTFSLTIGDSTKLWIAATNIPNYHPTQRRVLINFTILGDNYAGYDHVVKLNNIRDILTKDIQPIGWQELNNAANDPVILKSMWVSGGFLNVRFLYPYGGDSKHEINLYRVEDQMTSSTDVIKLEFRHDKNDDVDRWWQETYVCFDLKSLQSPIQDSVDFEVTINTKDDIEKLNFTYKY